MGRPAIASASVSRRVNREMVVLLGWGRAILLQFAHPLVAAGVADYSRFHTARGGYLTRARRTVGAMLSLTFGPPDEAACVLDRINGIHAHVHGALREPVGRFPAGTPYTATDPELLAWVHATLLDSILIAYETFVGPLTAEEKNQYCVEASAMTTRLGVPARRLPMTAAALDAEMLAMYASGDLCVGPAARELSAALLAPPIGLASPAFSLVRVLTTGLLPPDVRQAYGFDWTAARDRQWHRLARLVRGLRGVLPSIVCEWRAARTAA